MKRLSTLFLLFFVFAAAQAQDIIVKVDKTEIKAKVLEIDETHVKYKQWEFLDGPTYSVRKNEVFMVLYKNGKRETFEQTAPVQQARPQNQSRQTPTQQQYNYPPQQTTNFDIQKAEGELPIPKLDIARFSMDFGAFAGANELLSLRLEGETPLFKSRYFYWGTILGLTSYSFSQYEGDGSFLVGLSATARAPINYLTNPNENLPLKGLVPYFKSYYLSNFENVGFSYDAGVDWFFSQGKNGGAFGISAFITEFETFSLGLSVTL